MSNPVLVRKKLGDILEFQRGYDLPSKCRIKGPYPIISSAGFSGWHTEYKCSGENVVTGRYGTIGEVYYFNGKCWPLNTALFVKNFKGNVPQYVFYLLKSVLKINGKDKSTVPGVDRNVLHQMIVPFHEDSAYQVDICSVLLTIDRMITQNSHICSELEAMAKTLYDYWFVQFDFPDENGKPYRTSGGAMEWNEKLKRKIPKGWKIKTIYDILDIDTTPIDPSTLGDMILEHYSIPAFDENHDQWYLMVNREIENTGRKNFTIAHELGHYFLSHQLHSSSFFCNDAGISEESQAADLLEREANYFADCFLMPEPKITAAFKAILRNSKAARNTDFLYVSSNYRVWCGMRDSLMKRYGVSEAALRYRLVQLNLAKFDFRK